MVVEGGRARDNVVVRGGGHASYNVVVCGEVQEIQCGGVVGGGVQEIIWWCGGGGLSYTAVSLVDSYLIKTSSPERGGGKRWGGGEGGRGEGESGS